MKDVKAILFDLDGTLTDSGKGIMNSYLYAAEKMGVEPPPASKLRTFIGPPLQINLASFIPADRVEEARDHYLYSMGPLRRAVDENEIYEGIPEMLSALTAQENPLFIATSKRVSLTKQVIEHFKFDRYFKAVYGANDDGTDGDKPTIISKLLAEQNVDPATTLMIGDRRHDIEGAKKNGIRSIGVLWGYGSRQELEAAGADALAETPGELVKILET